MMERIDAQSVLFSGTMARRQIMNIALDAGAADPVRVNVWRNHAIEPIISMSQPFIAYGRWHADFRLSEYDDALLFAGGQPADMELLWLDSSRYLAKTSFPDWADWLGGRIKALRAFSSAPIIVGTWLPDTAQQAAMQALCDTLPAVYFADIGALCTTADTPLLDMRSAAMAGTPLSKTAQLLVARKLACHWMPAALFPPIKALALDLDNTLHEGVLGEDGVDGVQISAAHQALQRSLKSLRERGIFLALVSKNEAADVEALFSRRSDYPLRLTDFSAIEVSWGDKASAILRIADALRISPDAILYVDDNPGELASVVARVPGIHTVYAGSGADLMQNAIEYYPGLWRWKVEADDTKRVRDLQANAERQALLATVDPSDYFRSLHVSLACRYDPSDQLGRLADLCSKTNQFNLALRRFNQAELAERLNGGKACVVSVQLQDRLSDSGVIAAIIAERHGKQLLIEELCISCRALGRQLEDTIVLSAIRDMPVFAGVDEVAFRVRHGPRNQPALAWLCRLLGHDENPQPGLHIVPAEKVRQFRPLDGVTLIRE